MPSHDSLPMDASSAVDGARTRVRVKDQFRAWAAFYRKLVEGAAGVTTLVSPDGTILYASASIAEPTSLGYTPQLVIGHNLSTLSCR